MKHLCACTLLLNLAAMAATVYTPAMLMRDGQPAKVKKATIQARNSKRYWKIQDITPGNYYIRLAMTDVPDNCLYHNGRRLDFVSASPFVKGQCIAQSEPIKVENGDEFLIHSRSYTQHVGTMTLAKEPLPFAPQKHIAHCAAQKDMRFSFAETKFAEKLILKLQNNTGRIQNLKLDVTILDFFRIPVAHVQETIQAGKNFSKTFDYPKGTSDQYRAVINVTDEQGHAYEEVFPYLRNWTGQFRSKIWLTENWQRAEVKDDFTLNTRTLQPLPPPQATWRRVNLPTGFTHHLAWFKKTFQIPDGFAGQRWFLHFDRIAYEADIYLNGTKIHHYGTDTSMAPFDVEITGKVNRQGDNTLLLAVRGRIAGLNQEELTKKSLNKNNRKFYLGLCPGVSEITLLGKPKTFLEDVHIMTSFRQKTLSVDVKVPQNHTVTHRVLFQGKPVLEVQGKTTWDNPILWGPAEFPLLCLESTLRKGKVPVDIMKTRFGFREFWTEGMNLLWNGRTFRAIARPFMSSWGWGLNYGAARRKAVIDRIRSCKALGNTMLRHIYDGCYFPEMADEEGMIYAQGMVTAAGPEESMLANDGFWKHMISSNLAIVKSRQNYPSIFTWYVTNEMYAFSEKTNFNRVRELVRAIRKADPTRFTEAGCDLDLHGETDLISTHYPVEGQVFKDPQTWYPDMVYWRDPTRPFQPGDMIPNGQGKNVCNVRESSPIAWGTKPIIVNETGWDTFYRPPLAFSRLMGDQCLVSGAIADYGHQLFMKLAFQGQRDAGVSVVTPWRWIHVDDNDYILPSLDLVVIQKYHTFVPGTKPVFDVTIFHDILNRETLDYYWKLSSSTGAIVLQGGRKIPVVDCQTIREKIILSLDQPGSYELAVGIRGNLEKRLPITVSPSLMVSLPANVITAEMPLNEKELLGRAAKGDTIVLLPRKDYPAWLPGGLTPTRRAPSVNYTFHPQHPLLKGLTPQQLSFWYPHHRTGMNYFLKPYAGNAVTVIEAGGPEGLAYSGLLTVPHGKGGFIYCALDLKPEVNPIAGRLLQNMIRYRFPSYQPAGLIAGAGSPLTHCLTKFGVATVPARFGKLNANKVLIVDGSLDLTPQQLQELRTFPGTVLVQNPGKAYGLKTAKTNVKEWQGRAIRIGYFPVLAGITNQDMFFREPVQGEPIVRMLHNPKCKIDDVGTEEILTGIPMLYPVYLAKQGQLLFCNLNWMTQDSRLQRRGRHLISQILTNLGVKIQGERIPELPKNVRYVPLDLSSYLNRSMADTVPNDGKGGFSDQGPDMDMREFKLHGYQVLADIPFRIQTPNTCFALASRYRKGGYDSVTIPVNRNLNVLAWLHTHAYTSRGHHYSVTVNYQDGTSYEIRMSGGINLTDWANKNTGFPLEKDTLTQEAISVNQKKYGKASLYRTAWINSFPGKTVTSITLTSMKRGVPIILAISIGVERTPTALTPQLQKDYDTTLQQALQLQQAKDYHQAINLYRKALEMIPERLQPYRSIGYCYEVLNDYQKALETYQQSLQEDYNQPDLWERRDDMKARLK